jgi:DNA polymerase-3 subunit delta
MKLDARRAADLLQDPGRYRLVLLHGEDLGAIREHAEALVRAVAGSLDDPFRVADLDRDGFGRIPEEMAALALSGGRRVVRVREASDGATAAIEAALRGPGEALLVLEAPGLPARSRLRALVERAPDLAAVACYPDSGRALEQSIRQALTALGVTIDADAAVWLAGQLGADRAGTRTELEKLALYAGPEGRIDLDAARASAGDIAGLSLDDALFAATAGQIAAADRALELALAEGAAPVAVLRAALQHLQRLQRAQASMTDGVTPGEAARMAKPPVFFRRMDAFAAALATWSAAALATAATRVWEAERGCKTTGYPADSLCRDVILGLARRAASAGRR